MNESQHEAGKDLYEQGRDAIAAGDVRAAIPLLEQSVRCSPNYMALLHLGECLVKERRFEDAVIPLAAATTLNNQGIAPALLAEVLLELGSPTKASELLELAISRQPDYKRAYAIRPRVEKALAEWERKFASDDS